MVELRKVTQKKQSLSELMSECEQYLQNPDRPEEVRPVTIEQTTDVAMQEEDPF
jgi:hypothetical protein